MSLGKQAKVLTDNQQKAVLGCIAARRHAARNTLMFLLSVDAGLRSKEIALLAIPISALILAAKGT